MQKFYNSAAEPYRELLKMPILGLCTSQIGKPTTVEYLDICSRIGIGKDTGLNSVP